MKKTLLLATFISGCFFANAQSLQSENFNAFTVGNIGTDITGVTPGQGGFLTYASPGANSDWQIYNEGGAYGNAFQITGSATATGTKYMWKDGLAGAWAGRTSGNNIIEVEFDFFTGPTSTSKNTMIVMVYNAAFQGLAGLRYAPETGIISGLARYNNVGTINTYAFFLGAGGTANLTLTPNTWVRMGFSFNKTTGQVKWKGPGFDGAVTGAATGNDPDELDFLATTTTGNTVAAVGKFDNLIARATSTDTLLGIDDVFTASTTVSLYPNPTKDVFTLSASNNLSLTNIEIIDINGRTVKTIALNNVANKQINISDLNSGIYLLNIYSSEGKITKKIIKE